MGDSEYSLTSIFQMLEHKRIIRSTVALQRTVQGCPRSGLDTNSPNKQEDVLAWSGLTERLPPWLLIIVHVSV